MPNNGDLLNRKACKKFALKWGQDHRAGWMPTRVSKRYLDDVNTKLMLLIQKSINSHPSMGRTIKDFF